MSLALLFHYLLLSMFRMLVHPSSGACDLLWIYFMCCTALVSLCRLKQCFSLHKDTTPPQPNHTLTPTHIEPEEYNTWNKSTVSRKLLKMDVLTFETCWAVNSEIIKQVTSSWSIFIQLANTLLYVQTELSVQVLKLLKLFLKKKIYQPFPCLSSGHLITLTKINKLNRLFFPRYNILEIIMLSLITFNYLK